MADDRRATDPFAPPPATHRGSAKTDPGGPVTKGSRRQAAPVPKDETKTAETDTAAPEATEPGDAPKSAGRPKHRKDRA